MAKKAKSRAKTNRSSGKGATARRSAGKVNGKARGKAKKPARRVMVAVGPDGRPVGLMIARDPSDPGPGLPSPFPFVAAATGW